MPRVTVVQVLYNNRQFIKPVFSAIFSQTYRDFAVIAVISTNNDGAKEYLAERYPLVKIIDPGYNIGFAKGHNLVFSSHDSEFFQLVNPDLIMAPDYIETLLDGFNSQGVAAATGKLLFYDFARGQKTDQIDSTGILMTKSGRSYDRGQHEVDKGQYDNSLQIFAVSGAGAMLRASSLEVIKNKKPDGSFEYFDEDFHSYWEDVDLSWRLRHAGYTSLYVPKAVAYHGRNIRSFPAGHVKPFAYIKYYKSIPRPIRDFGFRNYTFTFIKNTQVWPRQFFVRQLVILFYILTFEWTAFPGYFKMVAMLPRMWRKRRIIRMTYNK